MKGKIQLSARLFGPLVFLPMEFFFRKNENHNGDFTVSSVI
jgi:hypothetical protein